MPAKQIKDLNAAASVAGTDKFAVDHAGTDVTERVTAAQIATYMLTRLSLTTYRYTASEGQDEFTGADANLAVLAYTPGLIFVFLDGALQYAYTADDGISIALDVGAGGGQELVIMAIGLN
jgi:hypothetical protein